MLETEANWQQHFPTYCFLERDIVLREYESAAKALEAEERLFLHSSNVTLVVAAGVGSLAIGSIDRLYETTANFIPSGGVFLTLLTMVVGFSLISLRYFADRQKATLFAKRKVVVLRRMLGLSYGSLQLVLPNWRVEGADEPFAIRLFPGWTSYVAYPFWIVAIFSWAVLFFLCAHFLGVYEGPSKLFGWDPGDVGFCIGLVWLVLIAVMYRRSLYDTHERFLLSVARIVSAVTRIRVAENIENTIYRAKLAVFEHKRLKIALDDIAPILLFVEDRAFFSHRGISFRGMGRAARDYLGRRRWSGGSTITQQLVRTLFIVEYKKLFRRKLMEVLLAWWLEGVSDKTKILALYLSSVRFDGGVYGTAAASRHFFGEIKERFSKAEAFFLVERIANIRGRVLSPRIDQLLRDAIADGYLGRNDAAQVVLLYRDMAEIGCVRAQDAGSLDRLVNKWAAVDPHAVTTSV